MQSILAALAIALSASAGAGTFQASELSIGDVTSGDTESSVLAQLGPPAQRVETEEGIELHYAGLIVTVGWLEQTAPGRQRRVLALYGTGHNACTPRGVCPGMPVSAATRLYGNTATTERETGSFMEYQADGLSCWLRISASSGVVESVAVACQP